MRINLCPWCWNQIECNYSFAKAIQKAVQLFYVVEIVGHYIFAKSEATTILAKIHDEGVTEFYVIFAIEPSLIPKQQRHNANELVHFDLCTKWKGNKLPANDFNPLDTNSSSKSCITVTYELS